MSNSLEMWLTLGSLMGMPYTQMLMLIIIIKIIVMIFVLLGDFGISRILMGTSDMATTFTGTPYYMSPEVLKHEGYKYKSDIWYD